MIEFKVKKLARGAKLPTKHNPDDAGIDVYANESRILKPGELHLFSTGIAVEIPSGFVALLWDRSSLGSKGIHHLAGVIDSGYRGEWKVALLNTTRQPFPIKKGDKIIQCVVQRFEFVVIKWARKLADTRRNKKGFGSSGR